MQSFDKIDNQVVIFYNVRESSVQSTVRFVRIAHFALGDLSLRHCFTPQCSLCICKVSNLAGYIQECKLVLTQFNKVDNFKNTK